METILQWTVLINGICSLFNVSKNSIMINRVLFTLMILNPGLLLSQSISFRGLTSDFEFNYKDFDVRNSLVDLIVLDSTVVRESDLTVVGKSIYKYEMEEGRRISAESYSFKLQTQELFVSDLETWEFDDLLTIFTRQTNSIQFDPSPLVNTARVYIYHNQQNEVIEEDIEDWSMDTNDWFVQGRTIYQRPTVDTTNKFNYSWDAESNEYILNSLVVTVKENLKETSLVYFLESGEITNPDRRITKDYIVPGVMKLDMLEFYDEDKEDFEIQNRVQYFYDLNGNTGYKLMEIKSATTNMLFALDSLAFTHNGDYQILESTKYFSLPEWRPRFKTVYTYFTDGRTDERSRFNFNDADQEFEFEYLQKYYYSTIDVETTSIHNIDTHQFELLFPNPCNKNDMIQVLNQSNFSKCSFWITSQKGVILDRGTVSNGQQISLNQIQLPGLYFITLFEEGSQKTWKIIVN